MIKIIGASFGLTLFLIGSVPVLSGATTVATPPTPAQSEMLAKIFPAIVRIEVIRLRPSDGHMTKQWSGGSGAIISREGHVLTNCHVSEDADTFRCYLYNGERVDAHLVGQDPMTDLAIIQLDLHQLSKSSEVLPVAKFGNSDLLGPGDVVFALGSPGFLAQSVTRGIVANPSLVLPEQTAGKMILRGEDVGTLVRWVLHDARIFGGNSGGPLVNAAGEIVGINEIGVFNLSGAIPGNLARNVADQLIAHGKVTRGWSGLTVQSQLKAAGAVTGIVISDVVPGSPAAKAGLQAGDVVQSADGVSIEGAEEKAVAHYYRLETGRLPGNNFKVDYLRAGEKRSVAMVLGTREPALAEDVEVQVWGAVVTDLTANIVRLERLPNSRGVFLENIRPAGPCGQAEPELRYGDVLIAVDDQPIETVAALRALSDSFFPSTETALTRTVTASVRRNGTVLSTVVELRNTNPRRVTPLALKAWLGAATQPLTPKLNKRLGVNSSEGGMRLTQIYAGTEAEKAGFKVGDIVLALDGTPVAARRAEDSEVLARQIRQYKAGSTAVFGIWRAGSKLDLPVILEIQPKPAAEMMWWEDVRLEFAVRDLAFEDRVRLQLESAPAGVLVENATAAGWAALAGLRNDDLILAVGGKAVATVDALHQARDDAIRSGQPWLVLQVQRRGQTLFIEINLKSTKK